MKQAILGLSLALISCVNTTQEQTNVEDEKTVEDPNPIISSETNVSDSDTAANIEVNASECQKYARELYGDWISVDGSCKHVREQVLNDENLNGSDINCNLSSGRWYDPFTDSIYTQTSQVQIDHMVPLKEAHQSGAYAWTEKKRKEFSNDLIDQDHLIAVHGPTNGSKGARDPAEWMPPNEAYWVEYAKIWLKIKVRWDLTSDSMELNRIQEILKADTVGVEFPRMADEIECTAEIEEDTTKNEHGSCGDKRYCGEMNDCTEAKYFLNECGVSSLDADKDGIPCESLCK